MDPAHVRAYARATAGDRIPRSSAPQPVAPPFYCATWETALALEMFAGLETPLPLGAMVHVSTEMVWARPLPAGRGRALPRGAGPRGAHAARAAS